VVAVVPVSVHREVGGEIMQTRLKIALAAAGVALAAASAISAPRPPYLLTLPTRRCPNPPGSTARHPLTRKMSVPQHRTSSRMTGTPRPIGRPDTSPKATALRRITPNEQRGKRHRGTGGGQLPLRIGRVIAGAPEWIGSLRS